ncbi:DMT family transporter [Marinomonas sp. 15G1-11]|uniref:DMT family transporter n=1 Tax=Marinomonas phaeophyticola TaxID=3004091 RepID=A0ABT4JYH3_9GAMM|nr:DMT family transporter [Marinomonas sp. 15G1-11]MCZ2723271.1 DMT family transporter [Marinomonas sp. 15G1-11]
MELALIKKGIYATIAYALIMSVTALAAKIVQQDVAVATLVFWQSILCLAILLPQQTGHWKWHPRSVWKVHFLRSIGGFSGFIFYYYALNHIPLVEASLLRTCAPLCVPFVVLLMHKTRIPLRRWFPLMIGFTGVVLIIQPTPSSINHWHFVGLLSAVGLAFSMVATRALSKSVRSQETIAIYFAVSALLSWLMVLLQGNSLYVPLPLFGWVGVVAMTLYVGMFLYTKAYTYAPASIVSPVSYIGVVFSGIWGWLLWGHIPNSIAFMGMLCIFISILFSARLSRG